MKLCFRKARKAKNEASKNGTSESGEKKENFEWTLHLCWMDQPKSRKLKRSFAK